MTHDEKIWFFGFVVGCIAMGTTLAILLARRHARDLNTFVATLREAHKKSIEELTQHYRAILMNIGRDLDAMGIERSAPKGLLQLIEENKPAELTVKETLEELLKRVE